MYDLPIRCIPCVKYDPGARKLFSKINLNIKTNKKYFLKLQKARIILKWYYFTFTWDNNKKFLFLILFYLYRNLTIFIFF